MRSFPFGTKVTVKGRRAVTLSGNRGPDDDGVFVVFSMNQHRILPDSEVVKVKTVKLGWKKRGGKR